MYSVKFRRSKYSNNDSFHRIVTKFRGINLGYRLTSATQELLTGFGKVTSFLCIDNPQFKPYILTKASLDPKAAPRGGLLEFPILKAFRFNHLFIAYPLHLTVSSTSIFTSDLLLLMQCLEQNRGKKGGMN